MAEVVDLGTARVERTNSPKDWTPLTALEAIAAKIKSGEIAPEMIYIAMALPSEGGLQMSWACAGGNGMEIAGLLAHHVQLQTERK